MITSPNQDQTEPRVTAPEQRWLALALDRSVIRRGLGYAIVVGAILVAINHGSALLRGDLSAGRLGQILLTVMVPYVVSTSSSVSALRQFTQSSGWRETEGRKIS